MATTVKRYAASAMPNSPVVVVGRIVNRFRQLLQPDDIDGIFVQVTELNTGTITLQEELASVAAVLFDSLQDFGWTADSIGYNFYHLVPSLAFPESNRQYQIEYRFVPKEGHAWTASPVVVNTKYSAIPQDDQ